MIIGSSSSVGAANEKKFLMAFVHSNLLLSLTYLLINTYILLNGTPFMNINFDVHTLEHFNESFNDANPTWMRFTYIALGTVEFGPTYQSLFAVFCVIILYFSDQKLSWTRWLMIVWFTFIIILAASRTGFLVFIIVSSLAIYYKERFTQKGILSLCIFLSAVFSGSMISPVSKFRLYVEPSTTEFFPENPDKWNSISLRQMELVSGINALKENWAVGVGTGGTILALRQQYDKFNLGDFKYDYTSHNQYIQTFLEIGVAGILALLACYIIPLRFAILEKQRLLLIVSIIVILTSCTTCILERSRGIIFFMTFASLFMIKKPTIDAVNA
jgi:O-antigen ligase